MSQDAAERATVALRFFSTLFGTALEQQHGVLAVTAFQPDDKRPGGWKPESTHWYEEPKAAAQYAIARGDNNAQIYFGIALHRKGVLKGRGNVESARVIPGVWADIDIAGAGHKGKKYPTSLEQARDLIGKVGLAPSVVVHTGGGLHCYWLFKEPWVIGDETDRRRAMNFTERWLGTLKAQARVMNLEVDSTFDLARVYRVPGTWNRKQEKARPVTILDEIEARYNPADLEAVMIEDTAPAAAPAGASPRPPATKPPSAMQEERKALVEQRGGPIKIQAPEADVRTNCDDWADADPSGFGQTWKMQKESKFGNDCSAYLFSLANYGIIAGWKNQRILDMMRVFEERWQQKKDRSRDLGKHDDRWYTLTLFNVYTTAGKAKMNDRDIEAVDAAVQAQTASAGGRNKSIEWLQKKLDVPIDGIEQHGRDNPHYYVRFAGAPTWQSLGGEGSFTDFNRFRNRVISLSHSQYFIPDRLKKQWDAIAKMIGSIVVYIDDGESEPIDQARDWVEQYLEHSPAVPEKEATEAAKRRSPFVKGGSLYVFVRDMSSVLNRSLTLKTTDAEVRRILNLAGYKQEVVATADRSTRNYWHIKIGHRGAPPMNEHREREPGEDE